LTYKRRGNDTNAQIEGMVDRICGLFPTTQIGRNTVKNAWVTDEFLLDADVDDARKARTGSRSTVRSFLIRCVNCTASFIRSLDRSKLRAIFCANFARVCCGMTG
jgi:hypothetical protein